MSAIPSSRRALDDAPQRSELAPSETAQRRIARHFRPDIEGMRAVAVLLVVLYHAHLLGITGGYVGVDVFFVISGFLITRQLFETQQKRGRVFLADFYLRRMKRLLPAAVVVTLGTLAAARIWASTIEAKDIAHDAVYSALYGMNFHLAAEGTNYLTADDSPSPLQHFWSLAVEEQFYFALPLIVLATAVLAKRGQRPVLLAVVGTAVAASLYWSIVQTPRSAPDAYFGFASRAWELGLGSLVALASPYLTRLPNLLCAVASWAGLGMIGYSAWAFTDATAFPGYTALLPVGGAALIIAAGCREVRGGAEVILGRFVPQTIGKVSYSLYLWHWPVLIFAPMALGQELNAWTAVQSLFVALVLSLFSYFHVELPGRRLTFRKPAWVLSGIGLSGATAAAAVVFAATLPALAGSGAAADEISLTSANLQVVQDAIRKGLDLTEVPNNLTPSLAEAAKDTQRARACLLDFEQVANPADCTFGDPRGTKSAILFGDSHAAHWVGAFDAAAKQLGWKVVFRGKVACPAAAVTRTSVALKRTYRECDSWRSATVAEIVAAKPDLVIVSQSDVNPGTQIDDATWAAKTAATLTELKGSGARVTLLTDVPAPTTAPADCLLDHLGDARTCVSNATAGSESWPQRRAMVTAQATKAGATVVDTLPWLCTDGKCPAIVGNMLVYRDNQGHLTNTYATWLAPVVGQVLTGDAASASATASLTSALHRATTQKAVPSNLNPALDKAATDLPASYKSCNLDFLTTAQDTCVFGDPKGAHTMVLFGDSHANQWFGAYEAAAKSQGWKVLNWTKSACPIADLPVYAPTLKRTYTECETWRNATIERIEELNPDLVVVSQAETLSADATDQKFADATLRTMRELGDKDTRALLMSDITYAKSDPAQCLAKHLKNAQACAYPVAEGYLVPGRHKAVAQTLGTAGFGVIDTVKWICTDTTCPVIVGNTLMYRDNGHITDTYARLLAPVLEPVLKAVAAAGK